MEKTLNDKRFFTELLGKNKWFLEFEDVKKAVDLAKEWILAEASQIEIDQEIVKDIFKETFGEFE